MARKLVTESDVVTRGRRGERTITVDPSTVITPSARDAATRLGIEFVEADQPKTPSAGAEPVVMHEPAGGPKTKDLPVALGSDHGGFAMKEALRSYLLESGYRVADVGTHSAQPCDYPDFAYAVAALVASGQASRGIMIDSVGVASAMVCNKVPGVRAAAATSEFIAKSSREHNDANVLTLGGKVIGIEVAKSIVAVWLGTWFGGGRHLARLKKIEDLERKFGPKPK